MDLRKILKSYYPNHTISSDVLDVLEYDDEHDYLYRKEVGVLYGNCKKFEFTFILTQLSGRKLTFGQIASYDQGDLSLDWEVSKRLLDHEVDGEDLREGFCVCSHTIHKAYYITHKETGITLKIGGDCIRKISEELYKEAKAISKKYTCKQCNTPLIDMRKKYHNKGFCGEICQDSYDIGIPPVTLSLKKDEPKCCAVNGCNRVIDDKYTYCYRHYVNMYK